MKQDPHRSDLRFVVELLTRALGKSARVRLSPAQDGKSPVLEIAVGGRRLRYDIRSWRQNGGGAASARSRGLWILRRAPAQVRDELRRAGAQFVDLAGAVRLEAPGLLVDRDDLPPALPAGEPAGRNPFADRNSAVLRAMLRHPSTLWTAAILQEKTGLSRAALSYVLSALVREELVVEERAGPDGKPGPRTKHYAMPDPAAAFRAWTHAYRWTRNPSLTVAMPAADPRRALKRLKAALEPLRWALTMHAAVAQRGAHAVTDRIHCYVDLRGSRQLPELALAMGWEPAQAGQLTLLVPYYRHTLWRDIEEVGGLPVVDPLQLALDLWHYPLRGREAARVVARRAGLAVPGEHGG
ncbi:MAG: type IV toxin-antitoxin system AbiEi family antitoxin [Gemmatimonadaceae bacterium]